MKRTRFSEEHIIGVLKEAEAGAKTAELARRRGVPFREAADPPVVFFKGEYWLFASHSLGYWHSKTLDNWQFVKPSGYAVEKFAPTAVEMDGKLYLAVSEAVRQIWVSDDPASGKWSVAADIPAGYQDPCLFLDTDGRLYMYDGLAPSGPLQTQDDPGVAGQTLRPRCRHRWRGQRRLPLRDRGVQERTGLARDRAGHRDRARCASCLSCAGTA